MPDANLNPGDLVVDLAGLLRSAAIYAGAIASLVSFWILKSRAIWLIAAFVLGGIGGFFLGTFLAPFFYASNETYVAVVKVGPGAFGTALYAALIGSLSAGILSGLLTAVTTSQTGKIMKLTGASVVSAIVIGLVCAFFSTRP